MRPIGDWSTPTTLSTCSRPVTFVCRPGTRRAPLTWLASTAVQDVIDERRLARTGDTGDGDELAQREAHRQVAKVVLTGAVHGELTPGHRRTASRRQWDLLPAGQVGAGHRLRVLQQVLQGAAVHDLAAVLARPGTDIDHPVGRPDRVLVVLHDDQRVAEVLQPYQRFDQSVVVALVQPDARLVQHVQDADQSGTDLCGQADPLRLTTGERARRPIERQVVQPDVDQEPQSWR